MQGQKTQLNLSILKIIWGALLGSHLMYGLALNFLVGQNSNATEEVNSFFLPLLSSMAIILFFIAIFSQKYFLGIAKKQLVVKFGQVDLSRLNIEDLIANFISPYVIRLALFEAVALFGFTKKGSFSKVFKWRKKSRTNAYLCMRYSLIISL